MFCWLLLIVYLIDCVWLCFWLMCYYTCFCLINIEWFFYSLYFSASFFSSYSLPFFLGFANVCCYFVLLSRFLFFCIFLFRLLFTFFFFGFANVCCYFVLLSRFWTALLLFFFDYFHWPSLYLVPFDSLPICWFLKTPLITKCCRYTIFGFEYVYVFHCQWYFVSCDVRI